MTNHWTKITSVLAKRTGLSFTQAKELYDVIKASYGQLTVSKVKRFTKRTLAAYKGVLTKKKKKIVKELERRVKEKEARYRKLKKTLFSPLPRSEKPRWEAFKYIKPAPKQEIPKPQPVAVEYKQKPKNKFAQLCREMNAPELKNGVIAKVLASQWRNPEWQRKMAETIAEAWKSIQRNGYVNEKVREKLNRLLHKIKNSIAKADASVSDFWYGILKQLYA